jgi:hypothetical protein
MFTPGVAHQNKSGMKNITDSSHREGKVAEAIEEQTAKLPSDIFLWASMGAMGASLAFKIM